MGFEFSVLNWGHVLIFLSHFYTFLTRHLASTWNNQMFCMFTQVSYLTTSLSFRLDFVSKFDLCNLYRKLSEMVCGGLECASDVFAPLHVVVCIIGLSFIHALCKFVSLCWQWNCCNFSKCYVQCAKPIDKCSAFCILVTSKVC